MPKICRFLTRDSKRGLYRLNDLVLEFWYSVYSPLRARWQRLSTTEQKLAIHQHSSRVLERLVRDSVQGAQRYWETGFEWDSVHQTDGSKIVIREIKASKLKEKEKALIAKTITEQFATSVFAGRFLLQKVEVLDALDCLKILKEK